MFGGENGEEDEDGVERIWEKREKMKVESCHKMKWVSWFNQVGFDQQVGQLDDELANRDYELSRRYFWCLEGGLAEIVGGDVRESDEM